MKKITSLLILALVVSISLSSCSSDDDAPITEEEEEEIPLGDYENGSFILNEGNGNPATASIAFLGDDGVLVNDIFRSVNPDAEEIGSFLQNIFFDDTRAFIISGSANSVTVLDRYTFEYIETVTGDFEAPRYGAVANGFAYVTNTGDYATGDDDFFTVINLQDYSTTRIDLSNWSEKVLEENGKLYIANGYYGDGNSISVFNAQNNTVEATIDLGPNNSPNSIKVEDGVLYVLTSGFDVQSKVFEIDLASNEIADTVAVPSEIGRASNLVVEDDLVYFTSGASVYSVGVDENDISTEPVLTYESNSEYGVMYGFNVEEDGIYISDGGDFSSNSKAFKYSLDGMLLETYTVGVGPNGFYEND
ncbi:YncE family protein [Marixanthomonas ophiurae]|uniref:Quinoprotein amine dehydrogenase n=1 Tax=Marixanthomonas ophiurae TaxID=387659 RepID=A0A3E1Q6W8_9FLAO|nr:DUF5074 domain-containing protein [Marixanthomonas ophiurae]RFN57878.1 hypothetical protein DZ858_11580 [Marixanthomonas ophiurae]